MEPRLGAASWAAPTRQQAEEAQEPAENKGVPQANLLSFQDKEEETKEVLNVKKSSESKR